VGKLEDLRLQIDTLDEKILAILEERAGIVMHVAEAKRESGCLTFHDPEREGFVLDRLEKKGAGRFPRAAIRSVFREIMSGCLSIEQPISIAFLGPEATFSHMAARHLFGLAARYREATTIEGVFDTVRRGDAQYGVVPFENSSEGSVTFTLDALIDGGLFIRQEAVLPISLCLLSRASGLTKIDRVYSHPQPLGQCRLWLAKNLSSCQIVQTTSTSAAAREALEDDRAAAVASRLAADLYGLAVLRDGIQDREENATRFVVIAREDAPRTGDDKTSLVFSLPNAAERGALKRVLEVFDQWQINLTRIESRPKGHRAWEYIFLADLEGHREDRGISNAVAELKKICDMVKVLGSYPKGGPGC
jgi:chorismate mutase / prephenate dehydratase